MPNDEEMAKVIAEAIEPLVACAEKSVWYPEDQHELDRVHDNVHLALMALLDEYYNQGVADGRGL